MFTNFILIIFIITESWSTWIHLREACHSYDIVLFVIDCEFISAIISQKTAQKEATWRIIYSMKRKMSDDINLSTEQC